MPLGRLQKWPIPVPRRGRKCSRCAALRMIAIVDAVVAVDPPEYPLSRPADSTGPQQELPQRPQKPETGSLVPSLDAVVSELLVHSDWLPTAPKSCWIALFDL